MAVQSGDKTKPVRNAVWMASWDFEMVSVGNSRSRIKDFWYAASGLEDPVTLKALARKLLEFYSKTFLKCRESGSVH